MTSVRVVEFTDDRVDALAAIGAVGSGKGWCNLTPQVAADDVEVLSVNVFALRVKRGAPVASYVTAPERKGETRPSTLGVLHTRGRLGAARISRLIDDAPFVTKQDHTQRGLLLEVPAGTEPSVVLNAMCSLLESLCDYERTGKWRLDVYERP